MGPPGQGRGPGAGAGRAGEIPECRGGGGVTTRGTIAYFADNGWRMGLRLGYG
jgi:hypothetical protein